MGFADRRYPRKLLFYEKGSKVVTAQVSSFATKPFDDALLIPPKGAIERRKCADMRPAIAMKLPMPVYPKGARQNRMMGDVVVSAVVLNDGTVSDPRIIGPATHDMDAAVEEVATRWKFRPAMCGIDRVVTDIEVTVTFRMEY